MLQKVAIIIERTDVALGGAERSISEMAQALSNLGLEVTILAAKGQSETQGVHVLCPHVPGKRVTLTVFEEALTRHLADHDYDIIHSVLPFDFCDVYQPRGGTYAESMRRNIASYASGPVRCYKRVTAPANLRRTKLLAAERRLCQRPGGPVIAALSQYVVDQLQEHYATDPQRIALILNGVETDRPVKGATAEKLRARILTSLHREKKSDPVLFLFAAHNFRLKGLDRLIKAFAATVHNGAERNTGLVVVGAGKSGRYQQLARRLGLENHIAFLGPIGEIQNVLSVVDVGILPTFYDPSSRFILETLAAGKPAITTRYNGAVDHFTDDRHGTVIDEPENISALTEAIRHFADRHNIARATKAITQDDLKERISIRRVARELVGLYESILERKEHI